MAEDVSTILASHAAQFSQCIFEALHKGCLQASDWESYRTANDVAVRLHLISTYLDSLPPYWVDFDVEQLCNNILQDLRSIVRPKKAPKEKVSNYLGSFFGRHEQTDPETCLVSFFKMQTTNAQRLKHTCSDLISILTRGEKEAAKGLPDSVAQQNGTSNSTDHFNTAVFRAIQVIAECEPTKHEATLMSQQSSRSMWHPARLCLHQLKPAHDQIVLVSDMNMINLWQEFNLIPQPEGSMDDNQPPLRRGDLCQYLEENITARLFLSFKKDHSLILLNKTGVLRQTFRAGLGESLESVLRHYALGPKDKMMLSYAIAQAYWQYYNSELMNTKWTSDTIWFMPENENIELPLCAYLAFPFGVPDDQSPQILPDGLLTHRCPRMFDIGVLLLEIGLCKPFKTPERGGLRAQRNLNHKIAIDQLLELQKQNWDGFQNGKEYFDQAVRYCLNGENFIPSSSRSISSHPGCGTPTTPLTASEIQDDIVWRRSMFRKNVVLPLAWLVRKGFGAKTGDITYVKKKQDPLQAGVSNIPWQQEPEALFHSEIMPQNWLDDLQKISRLVEHKRCTVLAQMSRFNSTLLQTTGARAVRIAILDTGLNRAFPAFEENSELLQSISEEIDFVNSNAPTMTDNFGHGTFMARLIMKCAPGVQILVARVAENTNKLESSRDNIKKAILWAGQHGKADIISMSFGFKEDDQGILEAIETVQKERENNIIFLASAGNSRDDVESFPARHPAVISIYATNCYGTFLQSNSTSISNGATLLGSYGDDIPEDICNEFSSLYSKVCQPGSSVATAVMAAISGTMLAYGHVLPSLVQLQGMAATTSSHVFKHIWTTRGMEAVLGRLAHEGSDHPQRRRAVRPTWFWKTRSTDIARYCAIYDTLLDIERRCSRV